MLSMIKVIMQNVISLKTMGPLIYNNIQLNDCNLLIKLFCNFLIKL